MKKTLIIAGTTLSLLFSGAISPDYIYAEKDAKDLKEITDDRKEIDEKLKKAEADISKTLKEIKTLNSEIKELDEAYKANSEELVKVKKEIENIQAEIKVLEEKIEERFEVLKKRALTHQETGGNITYMEVVLGAQNFVDFVSRVNAVNSITDSDAQLIKEQEKDKQKVEQKLNAVKEAEAELKNIEKLLTEHKDLAVEKKSEVEKKEAAYKKTIKDLKIEDSKLKKLEAEVIASMAPIMGEETASADPSVKGSGILGWPTSGGYISSPMGTRWGAMHRGIDIARTNRSSNPPILAADGGTVVSAGMVSSYGNKVEIDHGNGIKTLYAHLSTITVRAGQKVSKGDQIGVMGTTGDSTGVHLHFEVTVNGTIQNPMSYL